MPINILKEPREKEYIKLIQYAFKTCKNFVFSLQSEVLIYFPKPTILKMLEPYKVNELKALYYPQIEYYNQDAMFYFYECNEDTKLIILEAVKGLYDWRIPYLPEDLTFLDDKGEVWMSSISHENMSWIKEKDRAEVEFIKDDVGLETYWKEKVYTHDETMEAMNHLKNLIDKYFSLLSNNVTPNLKIELSNSEDSPHYGFWNESFNEYVISEHSLAFEIACFSKLLKLNRPIYAFDFSYLLNGLDIDTIYLVELLTKNIDENPQILYKFLEKFKLDYGLKK